MKFLFVFIALLLIASGCAAKEKPGLLPGRCITNEDCPQQSKCDRKIGWCEDIYFPRHEIKNY